MKYRTGNPVGTDGSSDPRDMYDNAGNLDLALQSDLPTWKDRLGRDRPTYKKYEIDAQEVIDQIVIDGAAAIDTLIMVSAGDFFTGTVVTARNQTVLWSTENGGNGHEFRWAGALNKTVPAESTPLTTGGIYPDGLWIDVGVTQLRRDLAPVAGIKHLRKLPNIRQTALSFHDGLGVGGGDYIWLPGADQSEHLQRGPNGGILWASAALDLYDGTRATLPALLNWVGSGAGCWEMLVSLPVAIECFGAIGNGLSSDVLALEKSLSSEIEVYLTDNKTYLIDAKALVKNKNVKISNSASATFKFLGNTAQISIEYDYTDIQPVSSVDNDASINMSDGTALTSTRVTKVTVADGTAYAAGEVVKIFADDILWGTNPEDNNRVGEHAVIYSITGNDIYLDSTLVENDGAYSTNVRIAKGSALKCSIGRFKIDGNKANNPNRNISHCRVIGCHRLNISGTDSKDTQGNVWNIISSNSPKLGVFNAVDGKTKASVGAFAHCVLLTATKNHFIQTVTGRNMRHLVDTTAVSSAANDSEIWRYGGVVGGYTDSIYGVGIQASAASTHNDADNVRFGSVISVSPVLGPNGGFAATGFRGRNCHVEYSECEDGSCLSVFTDENLPDNSRGHTAGHLLLRSNGKVNLSRAVRVLGETLNPIDTIFVDNITAIFNGNNIGPVALAENGGVHVGSVLVKGGSLNNDVDLIDVNALGSVEIQKFVGRNLGFFNLSDLSNSSSTLLIHEIDITTDETWGRLADLNGNNGVLTIKKATINKNGSGTDLVVNKGVGATTLTDWTITETQNTTSNRRRMPTLTANSAGATYSIDIEDRIAQVIYCNVETTAPDCVIGPVSNGKFYGQEIVIPNRSSSTESITINSQSDGFLLDTDIVLAPGRTLRGFWDGFDWRPSA